VRDRYPRYERRREYEPENSVLPTFVRPGSLEKIAVMTVRASAGLPLFLPGENTDVDPDAARRAQHRGERRRKFIAGGVH